MKKIYIVSLILIALISLFPQGTVQADVAPPESPPGVTLLPGTESTQVRMMAETVTLAISVDPANKQSAIAKTEAVFNMRNLGTTEEKMQARFPLSFFNGNSDGFGNFPEIKSIDVKVDGKTVPTKREMQPFFNSELSYKERDDIPWAVFDVAFPPGQDVKVEVAYTVNGFGYYPYQVFKYILETGAAWNGTIGTADIIVSFPYEVSEKNIWVQGGEYSGYGEPTSGGVLSDNEIRWHFKDLEPTRENNIQIIIVTPSLWKSVLQETDTVTKNPKDGEAWGRLAKAYKEILRQKHGELRSDASGREMFALSKNAYEKSLALLPKDSLWHYGYADLLWAHYYFDLYMPGEPDTEGILPTILTELQTALKLDPSNQQARELLLEISSVVQDAVRVDGDDYVYLGLTSTPESPALPSGVITETPGPPPTVEELSPAIKNTETVAPPVPATPANTVKPICGTTAFILPTLAVGIWVSRRNRAK